MDAVTLPAGDWSLVLRLLLARLLGAAVGVNREISQKPAGLRTHALVALGAALLTLTGLMFSSGSASDVSAASRIIQGIVAGIGFVGGGVTLRRHDEQSVHGLTTASSVWIVAATGVAVGAGLWRSAIVAVVLALIVLTAGGPLDRAIHRVFGSTSDRD